MANFCEFCGAPMEGKEICPACNKAPSEPEVAPEKPEVAPEAATAKATGKFCEFCGAPMEGNAVCPACNKAPIPEVSPAPATSKFCEFCGAPMEGKAVCPACNKAPIPEVSPAPARKKMDPAKKKKILIITIVSLSIYTVLLTTLVVLSYTNVLNIPFIDDTLIYLNLKDGTENVTLSAPEAEPELPEPDVTDVTIVDDDKDDSGFDMSVPYEVPPFDVNAYYNEIATVHATSDALSSPDLLSESQVRDIFDERGFVGVNITTDYSSDGEYSEEASISSYSSRTHPCYEAYYTTQSGNMWYLDVINGTITATPLFYVDNHQDEPMVIVSESQHIVGYDSNGKTFYFITPNSDVARIKTVSVIDAATLETLTEEVLSK